MAKSRIQERRQLIEQGDHGHYTVMITVWDKTENKRVVESAQNVAAESKVQAIRRAGMRLVQSLTREEGSSSL